MPESTIAALAQALRRDVGVLASDIGERNVWRPDKLDAALQFIESSLLQVGYQPQRQGFEAEGHVVYNLQTQLNGTQRPDENLIIGAHYDSRCGMAHWHGRQRVPGIPGTPGADDNATGVAATLALARAFAGRPQPCTLRFVAFVNEEPPFFQTPLMGSWVYAAGCKARRERIRGLLTPETLGFYSDAPRSQHSYFPLNFVLPSTGNFIAFLSNLGSRRLLRRAVAAFRGHTDFPALGLTIPAPFRRIGWSDDWAFWQHGYPALTITDTAFLRNRHYHTLEDTPEKLDFDRMATVVAALEKVVADLAAV